MTTWGGFGLLVCAFIITPIVLLRRSRLQAGAMWYIGFPVIAVAHHCGWTLGPMIFLAIGGGLVDIPSGQTHLWLLLPDMLVALVVSSILFCAKRRDVAEEARRRENIHKAIDKIMADGVVEGPGDDYVPHVSWNAGLGSGTPSGTHPPERNGPYGMPKPK
jgi:hypothetical protein